MKKINRPLAIVALVMMVLALAVLILFGNPGVTSSIGLNVDGPTYFYVDITKSEFINFVNQYDLSGFLNHSYNTSWEFIDDFETALDSTFNVDAKFLVKTLFTTATLISLASIFIAYKYNDEMYKKVTNNIDKSKLSKLNRTNSSLLMILFWICFVVTAFFVLYALLFVEYSHIYDNDIYIDIVYDSLAGQPDWWNMMIDGKWDELQFYEKWDKLEGSDIFISNLNYIDTNVWTSTWLPFIYLTLVIPLITLVAFISKISIGLKFKSVMTLLSENGDFGASSEISTKTDDDKVDEKSQINYATMTIAKLRKEAAEHYDEDSIKDYTKKDLIELLEEHHGTSTSDSSKSAKESKTSKDENGDKEMIKDTLPLTSLILSMAGTALYILCYLFYLTHPVIRAAWTHNALNNKLILSNVLIIWIPMLLGIAIAVMSTLALLDKNKFWNWRKILGILNAVAIGLGFIVWLFGPFSTLLGLLSFGCYIAATVLTFLSKEQDVSNE